MNPTQLVHPDLAGALKAGQFGLAIVDSQFTVVEREGPLSGWLPEVGGYSFDCALLFGMEQEFAALRSGEIARLRLPSIQAVADGERINVSIIWNADTEHFVIVTAPDGGTEQLERLLFRERRGSQLLRQQAAALADRSRIDATLYRDIVQSSNDAVLRLAADLEIVFVNSRAAAILGLREDEIVGRRVRAILPLPHADNPWRADMCAQGAAAFDQPARDSAGGTIWLWWDVRWLGDGDGPPEFQAVGRDVTQSRRLRAQVDKANEEAKFAALANERLRIAHDLHDTMIHSIVNIMARLSLLRRAASDERIRDDLTAAEAEAREGLREARESVAQIRRDAVLSDGPGPALAEAAQRLSERAGVKTTLSLDEDMKHASPGQATAMVRVAREAMRNVELHSGARNVEISGRAEPDAFILSIADDGIGFDTSTERFGHYGLVGMREQARLVGGQLRIVSVPGDGATLTLAIPRSAAGLGAPEEP